MMEDDICIRDAHAGDIAAMKTFIFAHGANQWNFLPEPEVSAHLAAIDGGKTHAVLAESKGKLLGFVTFLVARNMVRFQSRERLGYPHGYVCEAVVHPAQAGRGLGSRLLREAVARLVAMGYPEIYIERHEENLASAGMMRKAGFVEVHTFDDPQRRSSGSRRTTVCRLIYPTA